MQSLRLSSLRYPLIFGLTLTCWLGFLTAASRLEKIPQPAVSAEMQVVLPRFIQVAMAGGDRFLAANIAVFRALTTDTQNQRQDRFVVQAIVQQDASWLNPRHEDNYYLAAALLPWNSQLETAQHILSVASETRPYDALPPFFHAFNDYYFNQDAITGAQWLKVAAEHTQDEKERIGFEKIAARWMEQGQDRRSVVRLLEAMAEKSRYKALRRLILLRAERVRHLIQLDEAIASYRKQFGRLPDTQDALVESGILESLPQDPFGQGYLIDAQGKAQFKKPSTK